MSPFPEGPAIITAAADAKKQEAERKALLLTSLEELRPAARKAVDRYNRSDVARAERQRLGEAERRMSLADRFLAGHKHLRFL